MFGAEAGAKLLRLQFLSTVQGGPAARVDRTACVTAIVDRNIATAHDIPRAWVRFKVWLPPELAQQVRKMEARARARAKVAERSQ